MEWIVPFKGRNDSGSIDQNFLYREGNIYVMDNHRAALWCWLRHFDSASGSINLFHLDRHNDTLNSRLATWVSQCGSLETMDIDTYLSALSGKSRVARLFSWANYGAIFLDIYQKQVQECVFATHTEEHDDAPKHDRVRYVKPWQVPSDIDFWMKDSRWICNIDLDYFCYGAKDDCKVMFSDDYIVEIFEKVRSLLDQKKIAVLTIAFSPEWCGSWSGAEQIWEIIQPCLRTSMRLSTV